MNNQNFCSLPWIGIHAWPDGSVFPCCMYNSNTPLGNINKENIADLVNNDEYKKLRQQLLNGEKPAGCNRCYQLEESGVQTLRKSTAVTHSDYEAAILNSQELTMGDVKYLDVRFSNICNFKCRTCGPELSSKWGAEIPMLKNEPDPGIIQIPREKFWSYYEKALETTDEIVFAGGEALMQEEHYAALQKLIELKKFDTTLMYTTNLSTLKYKQIDLFDIWKKFNKVQIYASLDASGERAEYLRKGTVWKNIVENRKKIATLPGVQFYITPTISLFNVWHFPDFYKEWVGQGLLDPSNIRLNILTHPPRQQANVLKNKHRIIDKWNELIQWLNLIIEDDNTKNNVAQQFYSVINFLNTEPDTKFKLSDRFNFVNGTVDNLRNESLFNTFPELTHHLGIPATESKTFCIYPFYNINSNTDGSVKLCCNIRDNSHVKKNDGTEYNLGKDSIDEIWNSDYLKNTRSKMLAGEKVNDCKDCYRHEELSGSSSRTQSNKQYLHNPKILKAVNDFIITHKVSITHLNSVELRLGNVCNLACNSCWGYSSSRVNDERMKILKQEDVTSKYRVLWSSELSIPDDINKWYKNSVYKANIETIAMNLERVYITGGEPTLIKENRTLLQNLIDSGNTNCFISFTTNGTTSDGELLDLLKHFTTSEIQISLDGIENQANYIRYPINWIEFNENVDKLSSMSNVKIVFYTVVSAYNLFSIIDILNYVDSLAAQRPISWYPIFLDNPSFLRTHIWPLNVRKNAIEKIKHCVENLKNLKYYVGTDTFQKIYDYYSNEEYQYNGINEFIEFNLLLDKHRSTNFYQTFPELTCLI